MKLKGFSNAVYFINCTPISHFPLTKNKQRSKIMIKLIKYVLVTTNKGINFVKSFMLNQFHKHIRPRELSLGFQIHNSSEKRNTVLGTSVLVNRGLLKSSFLRHLDFGRPCS